MFNKRKLIKSILLKLTKAFVAIVIVVVVIYILSARMEKIGATLADKRVSAFDIADRNATAVKLREDFRVIDNKDKNIENALVPVENILDFVSEMENIAESNDISQALSFETPELIPDNPDFVMFKSNYLIRTNGGILTLIEFLEDIETMPYFTQITSILVNAPPNDGWKSGESTNSLKAILYAK